MPDYESNRFPEGPSDDEIEARLRKVREELEAMEGLPELPEDRLPQLKPAPALPNFDERLAELEAKAKSVKERRDGAVQQQKRQMARDAESQRGLGVGLTVAYAIVGVPLFAIAIGWVVDQRLGTDIYRGMGALIGSILGIVGAVFILNKYQNRGS